VTACFLDTNILLRYLTQDIAEQGQRSAELVVRMARGEESVITTAMVFFETIYTLQSYYRYDRADIVPPIREILDLNTLVMEDKPVLRRALDIYLGVPALSIADCFHAAWAERHGATCIYSFDRGFDRLQDVTRIEP